MKFNLKLEVFRISLKRKGGKNTDLRNFSEFFNEVFSKDTKDDNYQEFIKAYISSFKNEFKLNKDKTKGISTGNNHKFVPRSLSNIVDGNVIGGITGIKQTIFNQKDSKKDKGDINNDDVSTLPYYLKIWTPLNHNTGILMVQSYTRLTVTDMVKIHLSQFFKDHGFSLIITPFVPKKMKEDFKKSSMVYKVAFVKEKLNQDKRKLINPLFTDFQKLKVTIQVSGFKENVAEFWDKLTGNNRKIIESNLEDFDIRENEDFETIAYYEDEFGHKSHTSIKKNFDIQPTIFLDDNLKLPDSDYFDFDKIKKNTDSILEDIKKEIGYI